MSIHSQVRAIRRFAFVGEIIGLGLVIGPGLTSDLSGKPFIIAGFSVLALSLALFIHTLVVERKEDRHNKKKEA